MEKIKEQWRLGFEFKSAVRQLLNFLIGSFIVTFSAIAISFSLGIVIKCIITSFKLGYGLW